MLNKDNFKFIIFASIISFFISLFPILFLKYYHFGNPFIPSSIIILKKDRLWKRLLYLSEVLRDGY